MQKHFRPTMFNKVLHVAFVLVSVMASVRWLQVALPRYLPKDWAQAHDYDAMADYRGARLAIQGKSPYTPEGMREIALPLNGHPPTTQFWFLPLARFDKPLAAELVSLAVWFLLIVHIFICCRELEVPAPVAVTSLATAAILSTSWMVEHFHVIQLSEHIAFAYVVGWMYLRRKQDLRAGMALGVAVSLKLFPGVLLIFLLMARRWKAFMAAVGMFLVPALVMTSIYGVKSWWAFFAQQGPNVDNWIASVRNASVFGIVTRLVNPVCGPWALPSKATMALGAGVSLVLLAGAGFLSWRHLRQDQEEGGRAIDLPFALFSLLSVFLNVWAWEHYYVFLIQPMFVVGATLTRIWKRAYRRWGEEATSTPRFLIASALTLAGYSALWLTIELWSVSMWTKERILDPWRTTHNPWYHAHLHLLETINYLPWLILIALCMICLPQLGPKRHVGDGGAVRTP